MVDKLVQRLVTALRDACSECRDPRITATIHGYTCQYHQDLIVDVVRVFPRATEAD
jgi:hypothetical protein